MKNFDINSEAFGKANFNIKSFTLENVKQLSDDKKVVVLESGWTFSLVKEAFDQSRINDRITMFDRYDGRYYMSLASQTKGVPVKFYTVELLGRWNAPEITPSPEKIPNNKVVLNIENVSNIEKILTERILGQAEAVKRVSQTLFYRNNGLTFDSKSPIVFLFLGPTGVGKSTLAKILDEELFGKEKDLWYCDMDVVNEGMEMVEFFGLAGMGGKLAKILESRPKSVLVFDNIRADNKEFLQCLTNAFEQGYFVLNNGTFLSCSDAVFVFTSKSHSQAVTKLFEDGYQHEEIAKLIEPMLIGDFSFPFYNSIQPVIFNPIHPEVLPQIVDQKLNELADKLKELIHVTITFDESVRGYLIANGYQPEYGLRPLKKIIEKNILRAVIQYVSTVQVFEDASLHVTYSAFDGTWNVFID